MGAIPQYCEVCLKRKRRKCIAYTKFIRDDCPGYIDRPEDMVAMYKAMAEYAKYMERKKG